MLVEGDDSGLRVDDQHGLLRLVQCSPCAKGVRHVLDGQQRERASFVPKMTNAHFGDAQIVAHAERARTRGACIAADQRAHGFRVREADRVQDVAPDRLPAFFGRQQYGRGARAETEDSKRVDFDEQCGNGQVLDQSRPELLSRLRLLSRELGMRALPFEQCAEVIGGRGTDERHYDEPLQQRDVIGRWGVETRERRLGGCRIRNDTRGRGGEAARVPAQLRCLDQRRQGDDDDGKRRRDVRLPAGNEARADHG